MMSKNVTEQLYSDSRNCVCFSLHIDESTDNRDRAQFLIFIRMVFDDWTAKEELLGVMNVKERTRGTDIYNAFKEFVSDINLPIHKLVSITTDGGTSMIGRINGFITLCKMDGGFPRFLNYHCIIHQQALAGKRLNTKKVLDISFKIPNSIRGKALQRRLFREEFEGEPELLLHTNVRWLSRSNFL